MIDGDSAQSIGWSHSSHFGKPFHGVERKKDSARRRKWKRRMIVQNPEAPPTFNIHTKENKISKVVTLKPRMVLMYDSEYADIFFLSLVSHSFVLLRNLLRKE